MSSNMKKTKKWTILACGLALALLCGGVAVAAGGDQNDPLITLSYLEQTFLPQVVSSVKEETAPVQQEAKLISTVSPSIQTDIA